MEDLRTEKEILLESLLSEYERDFNTEIPQVRGDRFFWYLFNEAYIPIIEWIISKLLKLPIEEVRKNKVEVVNARLPLLHKKDKGKYTDLLIKYKKDKYLFELNNRFNGIGTRFLIYGSNQIVTDYINGNKTLEDDLGLIDKVTYENPSRIYIYNLNWHLNKEKAKELKPINESNLNYNESNLNDKLVTNYYINLDYYENLSYNEVKEEDKFFKLLTFKTMKELVEAVSTDKDLECYFERFLMFLQSEEREKYMLEQFDAYCKRNDEILGWIMRGRDEGQAIGYDLGQKDGYDLGQKNGYDLGQKNGYDLGRKEIVMNMFNNNMTLDVISKATKLSEKEIEKIIENSKRKKG